MPSKISTNNNILTHSRYNKCQLEKCHCSVDADLSALQLCRLSLLANTDVLQPLT